MATNRVEAPAPVTLAGRHVRLEPMSLAHLPGLAEAAADDSIWQWYTVSGRTTELMARFVEDALAQQARGAAVPFTVYSQASGRIVGSTRFGAIELAHRRAEIGWTWLNPSVQRTPLNTEQKYLMLRHAFEQWGLMRVEFKTDVLNEKSRAALARIGAVEEGTLRNHVVTYTGRIRHSVMFSVIDSDWPGVKQNLERKLARPSTVAA